MIKTYNIGDFPSRQVIPDQFMLERFEELPRPEKLEWPHKHNFYEVMWLTSGTSTNVIDYHQITIQPDTLFFISPGQMHLMSKAENVTGYTITFTEEFLLLRMPDKEVHLELGFLDNSYCCPYLKLDEQAVSELKPVLDLMMREIKRDEKSPIITAHLLLIFLNNIQRIMASREPGFRDVSSVVKFKKFKKLVEQHFTSQNSLPFYADQLSLSAHRVNEISKLISGKTAGEVIRERVLLEAKKLLLHSEDSIGKISDDLGFEDFSYFSRQFKRQEGLTPAAYRKEMYEKYQNL